ncbi:hypothetical protein ACHAXM_004998, partial [Skeletonema potamos]
MDNSTIVRKATIATRTHCHQTGSHSKILTQEIFILLTKLLEKQLGTDQRGNQRSRMQ